MDAWPAVRIVYTRHYNIGVAGMERLHPFDSRKYGRAWRELRRQFGHRFLRQHWVRPPRPIDRDELLGVHTAAYLDSLGDPAVLAQLVEIPALGRLPAVALDRFVLRPMRWATMGTVVAAEQAMEHGLAINLSGGYHHAKPDAGHGFCAYADVAVAIHQLRRAGRLGEGDRVVYVDLDAHQGDGVCHCFFSDPRVLIYDQYNRSIFPADAAARRRVDCDVSVSYGCTGPTYLATLRQRLPAFLDAITASGAVKLAIYNAGTDVFAGDQLGGMQLSAADVLARDRLVLGETARRRLPTVMVLSGGYSGESYRLVAATVADALRGGPPQPDATAAR